MSTDISVLSEDDFESECESRSEMSRTLRVSSSPTSSSSSSSQSPPLRTSSRSSVPSPQSINNNNLHEDQNKSLDLRRNHSNECEIRPKSHLNPNKSELPFVPKTVPCTVISTTSIQSKSVSPTHVKYSQVDLLSRIPLNFSVEHLGKSLGGPLCVSKLCQSEIDSESIIKRGPDDCLKREARKIEEKMPPPSKKLAFGIDRILSNDKSPSKEDESKNLVQSTEYLTKSPLNHHTHHPGASYLSQCSECFFLSRFCRRVQFPTNQISPSTYSWTPGSSAAFENSPILPTNGYLSSTPTSMSSYGHSFSSMSSMVSCSGGGGRRKRSWSRAVFSNLQRKGLEKRFQIQKYITKPDRRQLAATLGLSDAQVWFQNRRMKWRHSKEGKQGDHDPTINLTIEK